MNISWKELCKANVCCFSSLIRRFCSLLRNETCPDQVMLESSARWASMSNVLHSRFGVWLVCQEFLSQDARYLVPVWLWGRCGRPAFCPHLNKFNHAVKLVAFFCVSGSAVVSLLSGFELAAPLSERWFKSLRWFKVCWCVCVCLVQNLICCSSSDYSSVRTFEPPDLSWSGAPTCVGVIPNDWKVLLPSSASLHEGDTLDLWLPVTAFSRHRADALTLTMACQ